MVDLLTIDKLNLTELTEQETIEVFVAFIDKSTLPEIFKDKAKTFIVNIDPDELNKLKLSIIQVLEASQENDKEKIIKTLRELNIPFPIAIIITNKIMAELNP